MRDTLIFVLSAAGCLAGGVLIGAIIWKLIPGDISRREQAIYDDIMRETVFESPLYTVETTITYECPKQPKRPVRHHVHSRSAKDAEIDGGE